MLHTEAAAFKSTQPQGAATLHDPKEAKPSLVLP